LNQTILLNSELKHYGVLGMQWGVRKYQNKDGSLTPLGKRLKNEKAMLNVYDKLQKEDVTLDSGTNLYRVYEDDYSVPIGERTYASLLPSENSYYVVTMTDASNKQTYAVELEATKPLKIPSIDKAIDITNKAGIQNDEYFQNLVKSKPYDSFTPAQKSQMAKDVMTKAATNRDMSAKIGSAYKKEGYNVALDFNSLNASSKEVRRPSVIALDKSSLKISSSPIEKIDGRLYNAALYELSLNIPALEKAKKWLKKQGV